MEFEDDKLSKKEKTKIPFALRNKKTGKVLFCTVVANFTEFAANNYESKTELKDKNGVTRKIFFPLSNTCDLGKIKLKYEKSEEAMKLLDLIGISRYNLEASRGWKSSLKDKKNIYDEYGIHEHSNGALIGNVVSGLYQLNSNEKNPVNKNLDLSYGGWRDWDNQSTASNDFWHRFYEKICTEEKYQWMKFYRNLNMTLSDAYMRFDNELFCHGVLTTALSNGNLETLQKEIFDFGHFVGPDTYIYDFNEISPNDIDRYKNYLGFILWNKLPDEKTNKADYAKEILNYVSGKNEDLKKFIEENQVRYNDKDGRFEMSMDGENKHDANAWIYSAFFPVPSKNYPKYSFYKSKLNLPKEYQRKMETENIDNYGPVWSNKFKLEQQEILQALNEAEAEGQISNARGGFVKNVAKSQEWRKENFNFINNTVEYFKRDFNFENVVDFDKEEKKKLEKALKVKSIDSLLKRFFKNPDQVKICLCNNEPDFDWAQDRFEQYDSLSNEGDGLVNTIFDNIKETTIAKKCNNMYKYNVEYGFSRALFECLQVNVNYDKFIEELRINLSFYIKNGQGSYLTEDAMKLKTEFRRKFFDFKSKIQQLRAEYNSKLQEYKKNHNNTIDTKDPKYQEIIAISKSADEKQNEMDEEFFSVKDFDFLKKKKIIDENDFAHTNQEALEIAKNKINDLDLQTLMPEKKMSNDDEEELKNKIYNRFEDTVKNNPNISYEELVARLNKEILICKYNGLEKTLFNIIWEFDLELKNNENLENDYWDNMAVMRLYHLVQHFFHTAGILSDANELDENDMREIALNMEDVRFYLKTNPEKLILDEKKSAVENLIIRLFKGTSLEKNISDYIGWFKSGINDFCQMTTEVIHITQLNGVAFTTKNRQLRNGFFVNCDDGLIKNFCVPLQTLAKSKENHNAEKFKPNIKEGVKLADPDETCDLTLNDNDDWEILDEDQIFELSDKSFDILISTATYITPEHLKKFMDCWKREDYVEKMEYHLLNISAGDSIFGLINEGKRVNDKGDDTNVENNHIKELFPMIKDLYKNCQQTSLENAIEFLKMQQKCHYGYHIKISLEDLKNDFDFAVESMNKIWFRVDQLNIKSSYSYDSYFALLNKLDGILCQFEDEKFESEGEKAQKKAMDSHPELILALYILYYFGTKKYGVDSTKQDELRNIKNYEEAIFEFKNWEDFLNSISSGKEKYNRSNKYLRNMAEDFFTRLNGKDPAIQIVIDNYKNHGVFSSKSNAENQKEDISKNKPNSSEIPTTYIKDNNKKNSELKPKQQNQVLNLNIITNNYYFNDNCSNNVINYKPIGNQNDKSNVQQKGTGKTNKHNKTKIILVILTILLFSLSIAAIISMSKIFILVIGIIDLIFITAVIMLLCYKKRISKDGKFNVNNLVEDNNLQIKQIKEQEQTLSPEKIENTDKNKINS